MKTYLTLFVILFSHFSSTAQSSPNTKMHRIQDTTQNKSGLYYGKSTEGHFSVLLPIPFNDFTIKVDDVISYAIGSKSQEGIKFSVLEVVKEDKNKIIDLDEMVNGFKDPDNEVVNIKKDSTKNNESISFSVMDKLNGAIIKYVNSKNSFFTMIIEFPIEYKNTVEQNFSYFFSSLNITN